MPSFHMTCTATGSDSAMMTDDRANAAVGTTSTVTVCVMRDPGLISTGNGRSRGVQYVLNEASVQLR